jgi:mono/diheme cytochrome c family protein
MFCSRPLAIGARSFSRILQWTLASVVPAALFAQAQSPLTETQKEFFENNIRPVLAQNCATCHNEMKAGGLRVMSREDLLKGGSSGPVVIPGNPDKSALVARIRESDAAKRMPLGGAALKQSEIANIVKWVQEGAYWPETAISAETSKKLFEDRIRPILASQCFNCHMSTQMGGLRLDTREGMLKGGKTGPAIVPGDPEKSLLIAAVRRTNPALMMPKNGTPLPEDQVADLAKWVKEGAFWPETQVSKYTMTAAQRDLWSIQSLRKAEPPKTKDTGWALNDIDRFIAAKLEAEGMKPAPMADKRALLRRATYDLTGLPPTYAEVAAFEADKSPKAWEKVIDRLQASPRYGEKWARHWMDVVRFAEDDYNISGTNRTEYYKFAYTYRDWLIKSFNDDMPYDMFVRSQLAADLLDEKVRDKAVAGLGMNGLGVWHMTNMSPQIERADDWADKIDVTTKAFLGLTVACARCHDHKYDGIPTKDFYRLTSVFASAPYKAYPLVDKAVAEAYDKKKKELDEKEKALKEVIQKATDLESSLLLMQTESYMVGAWRVGSDKKATVESVANQYKLDAELLDRWVRFLKRPPLNYSYLKNWQAMVERGGTLEEAKQLAREFYLLAEGIEKEKAKIKQENETLLAKITDPNAKEQFEPLPNDKKRKVKILLDLKGIAQEKGQLWTDMFDFELPDPSKVGEAFDAVLYGKNRPPGLLKFTDYALEKRLPADWSAQIGRMKEDIETFKKEMGEHYPFAYGLGDLDQPVDLRVLVRGNPDVFGEEAPRGFLSLLSDGVAKPFTKGSGRLELADEILKQPIAARVIVNRVWAWMMGSGIVLTENNFGLAGATPSNPELLDYLAAQFRTEGMSIKKLEKEIMMSRTYQLSAETIEANAAKDSDNRLYWKANTRRLDAEGVWDYLLTASGKLDLSKIGGPSQELAEGMTRRGVYGVSSRMFPNNFQLTFDFITPTISVERRYATTIPQQGLFFLNSPMVHNQAEALADRIGPEGTEESRVTKAFEIVLQRPPTPAELSASIEFMHRPELLRAQEKVKAEATPAQLQFKTVAMESGVSEPGEKKAAVKTPQDSPLKSLCWALLSSTEFLYIN